MRSGRILIMRCGRGARSWRQRQIVMRLTQRTELRRHHCQIATLERRDHAGREEDRRLNTTMFRNQNAMTLLNSRVVRLADPKNFCNGAVLLMMLISHIIATTHRHASGCYNQTKDRNQLTTLDQCDDAGLLGPADIGATPSHPQAKPSGTQVAPHQSSNHKHCSRLFLLFLVSGPLIPR